jgi:peroxidase
MLLFQDEIIYQEARRLVAAEMQNVAYGEYLPSILGVDFMKAYDLIVAEKTEYDPNVDSSIFNAFATSAFRFGHSMINGMFKLVSQRNSRSSTSSSSKDIYWLWRLREVFDGQSIRGERLPLENMLEGLITQEPQTCDAFFSTEVTDHLFQKNQ